MITSQLNELKKISNLNTKQIAERADLPYSTTQKIFNGETQNPNVDYVFRIVTAMGYTMNDLYSTPNTSNKEDATLAIIREMYENRIDDLKEQHKNAIAQSCSQYEKHIADLKESKQKHGKTYKSIIAVLGVIVGVLFILFIIYFAMDYANEHWGIFFREDPIIEDVVDTPEDSTVTEEDAEEDTEEDSEEDVEENKEEKQP